MERTLTLLTPGGRDVATLHPLCSYRSLKVVIVQLISPTFQPHRDIFTHQFTHSQVVLGTILE